METLYIVLLVYALKVVPSVVPTCPANEEYVRCGASCEPTCRNPKPVGMPSCYSAVGQTGIRNWMLCRYSAANNVYKESSYASANPVSIVTIVALVSPSVGIKNNSLFTGSQGIPQNVRKYKTFSSPPVIISHKNNDLNQNSALNNMRKDSLPSRNDMHPVAINLLLLHQAMSSVFLPMY
ncbi:hypothetical protein OESDEN_07996 [Oesophagostomum dentatum]|uniref:Uncharacterized protein n=1 Tax=Oesophagostomum dentatum TaxID=61180 RepID=A0A0B1T4J8_OESDE|nr:hypothetical protein OESDEN_07996 [Oesophagostomum dentatum]